MHVGCDGWPKTLDFAPRSDEHLRDILLGGERADGSSLFPDAGIDPRASDVLLRPRLDRAFIDPFSQVPTLVVLCSHAMRDGRPLPQSPDTIVRAAHGRLLQEAGVDLWALGEVEFFLGRTPSDADVYGRDDRGYHASAPFVFGQQLRRRALSLLVEMGVAVKYAHSEVGYVQPEDWRGRVWEQHEIELALAPLPDAADAVMLTQWVLRNLARQECMVYSFEPVVAAGHAGSGLHVHLSPVVDGEPRGGRDVQGLLYPQSQWLIAGLVQLGGALMAFGNRAESSFTRLIQGKETPAALTWGEYDRGALVRLPALARTPDGRAVSPPTVELRLPDGSAHPHLLLAGIAQAELQGRALGGGDGLDELLRRTRATRAAGATSVARVAHLDDVQGVTAGVPANASANAPAKPGAQPRPHSGITAAPHAQEPALEAVPRSFPEVAAALARSRRIFEEGGVFPASLLDRTLRALSEAGGSTRTR
jgi:glutamine synthetase